MIDFVQKFDTCRAGRMSETKKKFLWNFRKIQVDNPIEPVTLPGLAVDKSYSADGNFGE